ncbi:hypothetical protein T484DRAFT_1867505, partial [Baffinella frigidus]
MDTESDEEKTEDCGGDAKKKKPNVQKCKCLVDGCDKSYRTPGELQDHVDYKHNGIYRNVCDHINEKTKVKCEYKSPRLCHLESHKRTHSDARPHKCTDCTATFKTKKDYDVHWVTQHSPPDHPAKCKCPYDCDESYRRPGELQAHVDFVHEKIYRNVCNHIYENGVKCVYKCERPSNLERHKREMHSDCDVECTDCTATFKKKSDLDRHWVTQHSPPDHPARTKCKCEECPAGFPTSEDLKQH